MRGILEIIKLGRFPVSARHRSSHSGTKVSIFSESSLRDLHHLQKHFTGLLRVVADEQSISNGRILHANVAKAIPEPDLFLSNSLVNMYCKCGFIEDAQRLFDTIPDPDIVSWNTIVNGYCLVGSNSAAFRCIRDMLSRGMRPDCFSFNGVLKGCEGTSGVDRGLQVHCVVIKAGLGESTFVANGLVEFYGNYGFVGEALSVFACMGHKDVVLINTMIGIFAKDGDLEGAVANIQNLLSMHVRPTRATFVNLLGMFCGCECLTQGVQIHGLVIKSGFESDGKVESSLVTMYSSCDKIESGHRLLVYSKSCNIISWTSLITGYSSHGLFRDAFGVFHHIYHREISIDSTFLVCTLDISVLTAHLPLGLQIHAVILKTGFDLELQVLDALMDMYAKCKHMENALKVFQQIGSKHGLYSWTTLISSYVHNGFPLEALKTFIEMCKGVIPDSVACLNALLACIDMNAEEPGEQIHACLIKSGCETDISVQTTLVSFYCQCGSFHSIYRIFSLMCSHDVISWTALISGYVKLGCHEKALISSLEMLLSGVKPNQLTLACALAASAELAASATGKLLHTLTVKLGMEKGVFIGSALVDMYSKCGSMEDAIKCFKGMPKDDIVIWNTVLSGYAQHGNVADLLLMYEEMQLHCVKPDGVTFLALLSGFSHGGLVRNAMQLYFSIHEHGIIPEAIHSACVVDALARAGLLKEALEFIHMTGMSFESLVLKTLFSSCITYGHVRLGSAIMAKMIILGDDDTAKYVMFSNLCSIDIKWNNAIKAREEMNKICCKYKTAGQSWIECTVSI